VGHAFDRGHEDVADAWLDGFTFRFRSGFENPQFAAFETDDDLVEFVSMLRGRLARFQAFTRLFSNNSIGGTTDPAALTGTWVSPVSTAITPATATITPIPRPRAKRLMTLVLSLWERPG